MIPYAELCNALMQYQAEHGIPSEVNASTSAVPSPSYSSAVSRDNATEDIALDLGAADTMVGEPPVEDEPQVSAVAESTPIETDADEGVPLSAEAGDDDVSALLDSIPAPAETATDPSGDETGTYTYEEEDSGSSDENVYDNPTVVRIGDPFSDLGLDIGADDTDDTDDTDDKEK